MEPTLITAGIFTDFRGTLEYVNEDNPGNYRRFYLITHPDEKVVRAWQGHKLEEKAFFVIKGSFVIATVQPADFENPGVNEKPRIFHLNEKNKSLLRVPGGHYNGLKATTPDSTLLVLSGMDLANSKSDDYRQPANMWLDWASIK